MFSFLLWLLLGLTPAHAQNTMCATRPDLDATNACASTYWVYHQVGISNGLFGLSAPIPNGDCVQADSNGRAISAGGPCTIGGGGGTVTAGLANQLAYYPATGPTVAGLTLGTGVLTSIGIAINTTNGLVTQNSSNRIINTQGGADWLGTYAYGDLSTYVGENAVNDDGVTGAARSSTTTGNAVATIGTIAWGFADAGNYSTTPVWGSYVECRAYANAVGIISISVTAGGSGYTSPPAISFTGGTGFGGSATATVSGGVVTGITVNASGSWEVAPTVVIGGPGSGAAATANLAYPYCAGQEIDITNLRGSPNTVVVDPYNQFAQGATYGLHLGSGGGCTVATPCYNPQTGSNTAVATSASAALVISPNSALYDGGIVFGCGSIGTTDCSGNGSGEAIRLYDGLAMIWYAPGNSQVFNMQVTPGTTRIGGLLGWNNGGLVFGGLNTSGAGGGVYLCIDTNNNVYRKASCP